MPVPENALVVTNIDALLGHTVIEAMRWETDGWEMFTKPPAEMEKKEMRVVSIATLLAIDTSLQVTLGLDVETGVWRESADDDWTPMSAKTDEGY